MRKMLLACSLATMLPISTGAQDFSFDEMTYTPKKTTFRLFAPRDAKRVVVEYDTSVDTCAVSKSRRVRMKLGNDGIWTAVVKRDLNHHDYRFCVDGRYSNGVFAKAVGVNGNYAQVLDMRETDPEGWENDHRLPVASPADLVIYEMHHRDFSIGRNHSSPMAGERTGKRVACVNPGKYLALTEPWAIAHLKELGVNAVHLLPSYDFGSVDEILADGRAAQYNWGYDPVNYNVPEGSYSTDPFEPACRIREFKQMVQALHKAGIRVILDVVYNHTYDIEHSNFQLTYPDYYYRKKADGTYSNGSGCGNETASEQPMMRRFMVESVRHWMNEYHIDGFRFDLMGVHDIETMNAIRQAVSEIEPTAFIYGEGWSAGECAYPLEQLAVKAHVGQMPGVAAFSDELRDALRGPFDNDGQGAFLAGLAGHEESLKFGIVGAISHPQVDMTKVNYSKEAWANEPTQMIAYVSCHDDMCLVDRLKASIPGISEDELIRLDLLAQTAVFTSQGVPFMLSGEEMLRDKKGVHNSFESPDSVNQLNWDNMKRYPQVFDYYRGLIQLRKNHPAFRLGSAELVRKHLEFIDAPKGVVAFRLKNHAGGDKWNDIVVVLNANREDIHLTLPASGYRYVCHDGVVGEDLSGGPQPSADIVVCAQSAAILHD